MNVLVKLAAVLIGLAGLAWLSGFLLPVRHEASASVRLQASPEAVWAVLTAVENYPRWRSDVATSEIIRSKPVLTWRQTDLKGRVMTHTEGLDRPIEKWADHLSGGDLDVGGERVFLIVGDSSGGSTVALTESAEIKDPLARFRARFVTGYTKDLKQVTDDLRKRLAE